MPELPEVETVVRDLRPALIGRVITGVRPSRVSLRRPWDRCWSAALTGRRITAVRRRGKWILIDLSGGGLLRIHLGMTGQLTVVPAGEPEPDHLHLVFSLDDGHELRLRDVRRFGSAEFYADGPAAEAALDRELGPEPFELDAATFRATVTRSKRPLKAVLLDQRVVAGLGNIYADESLFRAGLDPRRRGDSLTAVECDRLRWAIAAVLRRAVASRGSTIRDYIGGSGLRGRFQEELAVYGRAGLPCRVCGTPVMCVRLAGRSSHFCPRCQPPAPDDSPGQVPRDGRGRRLRRPGSDG